MEKNKIFNSHCDHSWLQYTNSELFEHGFRPAIFACTKCYVKLTSNEILQMESIKEMKGFQKKTQTINIIVLIGGFLLSIISVLYR